MNGLLSKPKITALICTLNEEENLAGVLERIPDYVHEILLVDGHSTDNTYRIARQLYPAVHCLIQTGKGKGDALKHGFAHAQGDIIVTLDADGATDPQELYKFIEPLLQGYDYVKGSRFRGHFPRHKPFHRIMGNWIITLTFNLCYLKTYTDLCSGYNAVWKEVAERVKLWSEDGYENEPLINCRLAKSGIKIAEVGHADRGRLKGEVKETSWRQGLKAIKSIIRERFRG